VKKMFPTWLPQTTEKLERDQQQQREKEERERADLLVGCERKVTEGTDWTSKSTPEEKDERSSKGRKGAAF